MAWNNLRLLSIHFACCHAKQICESESCPAQAHFGVYAYFEQAVHL